MSDYVVVTLKIKPSTRKAFKTYKQIMGLTQDQFIQYLLDKHIAREVRQREMIYAKN